MIYFYKINVNIVILAKYTMLSIFNNINYDELCHISILLIIIDNNPQGAYDMFMVFLVLFINNF